MAHYEDISIDQGTDVAVEVHLTERDGSAKDLNNHAVSALMKKNYNSDSADTVAFSTAIPTPAADGILVLGLSNEQTDALEARRRYVYDVEISYRDSDQNMIIERVLEGKVYVNPSVTR